MGDFWEQHCRLCLNPTNDESFEEITDVTKEILDILFLKLSFDNNSKYVMCKDCSLRLSEALKFKSTCLYTDNSIIPYVDGEKVFSVDLREIYADKVGNKELTCIIDDLKVCRLCMKLIKDEFQLVNDKWIDLIEKYIPELNIGVVQEPVVCARCCSSFDSHSGFMQNCLDVEEKIKRVSEDQIVGSSSWARALNICAETKRDEMKFREQSEEGFADVKYRVTSIKNESLNMKPEVDEEEEEGESGASSFLLVSETENESDVSDEWEEEDVPKKHKSLRGNMTKKKKCMEKAEKNKKDDSEQRTYRCYYCSYKTKNLNSLTGHHRFKHRDKDASGVPVYTCDICGLQTRHKRSHMYHQIQHRKQADGGKFKCDRCSFITVEWWKLKRHELTHKKASEMPTYRCGECKYRTNYKPNLARHSSRHRTGNKPVTSTYRCMNCPYETKCRKSFLQHVSSHKYIFRCKWCRYKTKKRKNLEHHLTAHEEDSDVPVYKCSKCTYRSLDKKLYKRHLQTHKKDSEVTLYKCHICGFQTRYKYRLPYHFKTHNKSNEGNEGT